MGDVETDIARAPTNGGVDYPFAEAVLINCTLEGVWPGGWGAVGPDTTNIHYWEYNSVDEMGMPVDVSRRVPYSRQLTMANDAKIIADYSDPAFVLGGWKPELAPIVLNQLPERIEVAAGGNAEIEVSVAAAPEASYQWLKDGQPLAGKTSASLTLTSVTAADRGAYSVRVDNGVGMVVSAAIDLVVDGMGAPAAGTSAPTAGASAGAPAAAGRAGAPTSTAGQPGAAGATGGSSASAAAGTGAQSAGAAGAAGAATIAGGEAAPSSMGGGGCQIGAQPAAGRGVWTAVVVALCFAARARRRVTPRPRLQRTVA